MWIIRKIAELACHTIIGKQIVDYIRRKRNVRITIREVSRKLDDSCYYIMGDSEEAFSWCEMLKKKTGRFPEAFLTDGDITYDHIGEMAIRPVESIISVSDKSRVRIVIIPCIRIMPIIEKLLDYGCKKENIIIGTRDGKPDFGGKLLDCYDVNLGFSRIDDLPGFVVFGKEKLSDLEDLGVGVSKPIIIVTLGGSTTDAYYANFRSWSEILYDKINSSGINAILYCGGICSYNSSQELMKLIRDVIPIKPDLVISYSGTNDQYNVNRAECVEGHPFVRQFELQIFQKLLSCSNDHKLTWITGIYNADKLTCGPADGRNLPNVWVSNEQMMHAVCESHGILFHGFLQPSPEYGGYLKDDLIEYSIISNHEEYGDEVKEWYKNALSEIQEKEYIHDFTRIFEGMSSIFYDECHVLEKGNKIIAENIYRIIVRDIRKMGRR